VAEFRKASGRYVSAPSQDERAASISSRREWNSHDMARKAGMIILQAIIQYAEAMNIPQKWRESLVLEVDRNRVRIHNTWVKPATKWGPEIPLGDIFENGSRDHDITVRFAKALHWNVYDVVPTGVIYGVTKEDRFAKRVHVRGIRGLHPMKRGLRTGMGRVRSWLDSKKRYAEWSSGFRPKVRLYHGFDDPLDWQRPRLKEAERHMWVAQWSKKHMLDVAEYYGQEKMEPPIGGGKYASAYPPQMTESRERRRLTRGRYEEGMSLREYREGLAKLGEYEFTL